MKKPTARQRAEFNRGIAFLRQQFNRGDFLGAGHSALIMGFAFAHDANEIAKAEARRAKR